MHRRNKLAFTSVQQYFYDAALIVIVFIISYIFVYNLEANLKSIFEYSWIILIYGPLWIFSMNGLRMYDITTFQYYDRIARNVLFSAVFSGILTTSITYFIEPSYVNKTFLMVFIILNTVLQIPARIFYRYIIYKGGTGLRKNIIIIGSQTIADKYIYYISKTNIQVNLVGLIRIDSQKSLREQLEFGANRELDEILKVQVVDEVVFAVPHNYIEEIEKYALLCEEMGVTVSMVLDLYHLKIAKTLMSSIGTLPVLTFHTVCLNNAQLFLKRTIDIIGATIGLLITAIISIFIIPAIELDSKGPVIFSQYRVGINGRKFKMYKFRTMVAEAEVMKEQLMAYNQSEGNYMFKIKDDPRITRVGKFLRSASLDELPQFINVIKGDMSLVGTRPPIPEEVGHYENRHWRRISIKPGITGIWQVSGRSKITDFDQVVSFDTMYIDNWTVFLDIKIMIQTIFVIFKRKGAM